MSMLACGRHADCPFAGLLPPEPTTSTGLARLRLSGAARAGDEGTGRLRHRLAILAPADTLKAERNDGQAPRQAAGALGLKLVYKRDLLTRLREAHGPEEIALMEQAIAATRAGHEAAARATVAGVSERDVQTQMEFGFFSAGATGLSYGPIVGSGENGAVLHWGKNSRILRDGDVVVIDSAAEYGPYAADATRT